MLRRLSDEHQRVALLIADHGMSEMPGTEFRLLGAQPIVQAMMLSQADYHLTKPWVPCVDLCDLLRAARARTGDLTGAVEAARRRVQLRPLEEVGYRALMELQADLGDRAEAVSTYHHCASVLERELGVVPVPARPA